MPFSHVNQRRLYFELTGHGQPVVLLHHATASSRNWRRQTPLLAQDHQVLTYDRPGFGRSDWLPEWSLDYLDHDVADLIGLLDALGIEDAALVGHSDGAAIALLAAARHPDRVRRVLAEAPHIAVETPRCSDAIRQFVAELPNSPQIWAALERDHGQRAMQVVERWAGRWLDPAFWAWNAAEELRAVQCPALVVHGAADPYFSLEHAQLIADHMSQSRLVVLPGVAHVPHVEAVSAFNQILLDFIPA